MRGPLFRGCVAGSLLARSVARTWPSAFRYGGTAPLPPSSRFDFGTAEKTPALPGGVGGNLRLVKQSLGLGSVTCSFASASRGRRVRAAAQFLRLAFLVLNVYVLAVNLED